MSIEAKILVVVAAIGLLLITAEVAVAQPISDNFWIRVGQDGVVIGGGGSGYDGDGDGAGDWYHYPNTNWWNQWFYDHPFDPNRWKKIDIPLLLIGPIDPAAPNWAEVTYNWSTPGYPPNPGQPPLPPLTPEDEAEWIMRADPPIFEGELTGHIILDDSIIIPDYNPEWVSIDVRGYNFEILLGIIEHECIPEPATLSLLVLGGLALIRRRRK